jgi:hypothetical protein
MSLYQTWYFMSLVGGIAGLGAWCITDVLQYLLTFPAVVPDLVPGLLLGGFLGGMAAGFDEHWSGKRVSAGAVLKGAGLGVLAGVVASLFAIPMRNALLRPYPAVYRILTWMTAAALIGLALGARLPDRSRIGHPVTGGLVGGLAGGILFTAAGSSFPDVTNALCFTLTGMGISSGLMLTPTVAREAVLLFVRSGDARAQSKLGRSRKTWPLQEGRNYVIGSGEPAAGPREVVVGIPDAAVAARHALIYSRDGRYFIARHEENRAPAAVARYPLKVGGRTITSARRLEHLDDITIGKTALKFQVRAKEGR